MQEMQAWSLAQELRSHVPQGEKQNIKQYCEKLNKDLKTTQEFQLPLASAWIPSLVRDLRNPPILCVAKTNQPTNQTTITTGKKKKKPFIIPLVSSGGPRRINCILSLVSSRILSVPDCRKVVRTPYDPLYPPRFSFLKSEKITQIWILNSDQNSHQTPCVWDGALWTCLLDARALDLLTTPLGSRRTILRPVHPIQPGKITHLSFSLAPSWMGTLWPQRASHN